MSLGANFQWSFLTVHTAFCRSLAPSAYALPIPEGSWTARQIRNPDAETGKQPSKLNIRTAQVTPPPLPAQFK